MAQSLEAALDEERREIMALLEGRANAAKKQAASIRAASPTPQSPVRSMLDFDGTGSRGVSPMLRHASIAGQGVGVSQPAPQVIRSMLDFGGPKSQPMQTLSGSKSAPMQSTTSVPRINLEKEYNFDIVPGAPEIGSLPKRVSLGGKPIPTQLKSTGIFGSADSKTRSDGSSALFGKARKSSSPGLFGSRAKSPATHKLNNNSSSLMTNPNTYVTDSGRVIDMTSAYRRLSDAALLKSGSSLARLPTHRGSDTGEQVLPDGSTRMTMDTVDDDDDAIDSNEESSNDSDDEDWASEVRGRNRTRKESNDMDEDIDPRQAKSLLGAAEEESKWSQPSKLY
jgi:hypothetical protein